MPEDLKIVFYIVVTLLWFFYSNYRKLKKKAKERDISNAPDTDNRQEGKDYEWERDIFPPTSPEWAPDETRKALDYSELPKNDTNPLPKLLETPALEVISDEKKKYSQKKDKLSGSNRLFVKIASRKKNMKTSILREINQTNWKKAVILAEILKRPNV
jgi:hypothetical protein